MKHHTSTRAASATAVGGGYQGGPLFQKMMSLSTQVNGYDPSTMLAYSSPKKSEKQMKKRQVMSEPVHEPPQRPFMSAVSAARHVGNRGIATVPIPYNNPGSPDPKAKKNKSSSGLMTPISQVRTRACSSSQSPLSLQSPSPMSFTGAGSGRLASAAKDATSIRRSTHEQEEEQEEQESHASRGKGKFTAVSRPPTRSLSLRNTQKRKAGPHTDLQCVLLKATAKVVRIKITQGRLPHSRHAQYRVSNNEYTSVCIVCRDGASSDVNPIVFCDGPCEYGYHKQCYGISYIPNGDWFCSPKCAQGKPPPPFHKHVLNIRARARARVSRQRMRTDMEKTGEAARVLWAQTDPFFQAVTEKEVKRLRAPFDGFLDPLPSVDDLPSYVDSDSRRQTRISLTGTITIQGRQHIVEAKPEEEGKKGIVPYLSVRAEEVAPQGELVVYDALDSVYADYRGAHNSESPPRMELELESCNSVQHVHGMDELAQELWLLEKSLEAQHEVNINAAGLLEMQLRRDGQIMKLTDLQRRKTEQKEYLQMLARRRKAGRINGNVGSGGGRDGRGDRGAHARASTKGGTGRTKKDRRLQRLRAMKDGDASDTPSSGSGYESDDLPIPSLAATKRHYEALQRAYDTAEREQPGAGWDGLTAQLHKVHRAPVLRAKTPYPPTVELYCACQTPNAPHLFYIECERCESWFHGRCVGITSQEATWLSRYICPACAFKLPSNQKHSKGVCWKKQKNA